MLLVGILSAIYLQVKQFSVTHNQNPNGLTLHHQDNL